MSYNTINEMFQSQSLKNRIIAAAAQEDIINTMMWVESNLLFIVANEEWTAAWEFAKAAQTLDNNPDMGIRPSVITDQMILSAVQARKAFLASQETPTGPEPAI